MEKKNDLKLLYNIKLNLKWMIIYNKFLQKPNKNHKKFRLF